MSWVGLRYKAYEALLEQHCLEAEAELERRECQAAPVDDDHGHVHSRRSTLVRRSSLA